MGQHIHILTSVNERMQRIHLIKVLSTIWQEGGSVLSFGDSPPPRTNIAIAHTDHSVISDGFFNKVNNSLQVINGRARNILKSTVSQALISPDSDWDGPVIVKTDANAHAGEEYAYHRLDIPRLMKIVAARAVPWQWVGELPLRRYPILDHKQQVPGWVWQDNRLIVERFIPERDDKMYVLRLWMFFGRQEYCMRVLSEEPIVKSRKLVKVELVDEVPDEVRRLRQKLGLDFGKIDYVIHDDRPVVFDVNKTPTVFLNRKGQPGPYVRRLADGLKDFVN